MDILGWRARINKTPSPCRFHRSELQLSLLLMSEFRFFICAIQTGFFCFNTIKFQYFSRFPIEAFFHSTEAFYKHIRSKGFSMKLIFFLDSFSIASQCGQDGVVQWGCNKNGVEKGLFRRTQFKLLLIMSRSKNVFVAYFEFNERIQWNLIWRINYSHYYCATRFSQHNHFFFSFINPSVSKRDMKSVAWSPR